MGRRQPPVQQAPPAHKVRLRYAKRGPMRFTSHRDVGRALERALRRAEIPMAYSSGFSPHPRISYAGASPTGAASEAEYVELGLRQVVDPAKLSQALNQSLPPGLTILDAATALPEPMAELLQASDWEARLDGIDAASLKAAVAELMSLGECVVERMTKNGMRAFDVRGAVVSVVPGDGSLEMRIRHLTPLVRPDDVVSALRRIDPTWTPASAPLLTRRHQGRLADGALGDPLRIAQDAV
ncbi:MAG: TIGR03936 family radical SAM-associated protein [Arachnia sp.]